MRGVTYTQIVNAMNGVNVQTKKNVSRSTAHGVSNDSNGGGDDKIKITGIYIKIYTE